VERLALVLPSSTYKASQLLRATERLGLEPVVVTDAAQALEWAMGDRLVVADLDAPASSAEALLDRLGSPAPLAFVGVDDATVQLANAANALLGAPHHPPDSLRAALDKGASRRRWADAGVVQPNWTELGPDDDPAIAVRAIGFPAVVKPVGLTASRGVQRVDNPDELADALAISRRLAVEAGRGSGGRVLVEALVDGPEVALDGIVAKGRLHPLAVFDKPEATTSGPTFPETVLVTPSRLPPADLLALANLVQAAVSALGLLNGPVHAEARFVGPERPMLLELAPRTIGGRCGEVVELAGGATLAEAACDLLIGRPLPRPAPRSRAAGVRMVLPDRSGTFRGFRGIDATRALPGITGVEVAVRSGTPVAPLPEDGRYLAFIFARGRSAEEVETALAEAGSTLASVIEPLAAVAGTQR
jgi:biotin carboxylase